MLEKDDAPNQAMRMAERLGLYNPETMDMTAPVAGSLVEFVNHHAASDRLPEPTADDDIPTGPCEVANVGCEAPAGFLINGMAVPADNTGAELQWCPECGATVCMSCGDSEGRCAVCAEFHASAAE
jgi:hypothetical protein